MANPEHLAILKQGVGQWNKWMLEHQEVTADLSGVRLEEADLSGVWFVRSDLTEADFFKADLRGASLVRANLRGARLALANLHDADIKRADLTRANLHGANLANTELFEANLEGADLQDANLYHASLFETDLTSADLRGADLSDANLCKANLTGTTLDFVNLAGADLGGTDFTAARVSKTYFTDVDLSTANGLETIEHLGPSTVGIDTIYKSRGKIPEVFLRGCGVPDEFIAYIGSMVGRPIEFYSCFISYSTRDQEFAERLHADLQAKGVRCWFAPHDIKGGRKIHEQIDEAIRTYDKLLLILSEHSMSSSWVKTEIANAREREEREAKQLLFPITLVAVEEVKQWKLFDADRGVDSAREIREYFLPDFRNWDKDNRAYQAALERLIRDLKAG